MSFPAEVLNLPPGLGDDLGLVGVHRHAHEALQRPVTPSLHPVNKKNYLHPTEVRDYNL